MTLKLGGWVALGARWVALGASCVALTALRMAQDGPANPPARSGEVQPVTTDELLAELRDAPKSPTERVGKLVEAFTQAGAPADQVQVVPLIPYRWKPLLETASNALREHLTGIGATPSEVQAAVAGLEQRVRQDKGNVVARLPGRSDRVLLFAAHVDAVEGTPGVIDNWSGCVLLANLYQAFCKSELEHTLVFIGFGLQEEGCLGSAAWLEALPFKDLQKIDAAVTVECAGVSSPYAWWSGSNQSVIEVAHDAAAAANLPFQYLDFPGTGSDSLCFRRKFVPVLALLGIEPAQMGLLHGPEDRMQAVDPRKLEETYRLLCALVPVFDPYAEPLRWDYVKAKLKIGDPVSGRKVLSPTKVDLSAVVVPPSAPVIPISSDEKKVDETKVDEKKVDDQKSDDKTINDKKNDGSERP